MRHLAAAFIFLAVLTPPACDTCGPPERCAYPTLLLLVHDVETGDPLPDATITQDLKPLSTELTSVSCAAGQCTHGVSPVAGRVMVSLPGYQDAFVDFVPHSNTCGAPIRQFADVGMRALSYPDETPVITGPADRGAGCN